MGQILTKNRNRLGVATCIDLVFVRTWLRRELKPISDDELEVFKHWETQLLREASFYNGVPDPDAGQQRELRIFEDRFEDWEQNAIDGRGAGPRILLGDVKRDKASMFRLQEKYKHVFFVDKDPDGDTTYYTDGGDPVPQTEWEHRKVMGLVWENQRGWRLETKLCSDLAGTSANYIMNAVFIRMVKESTRNRRVVRFRSDI